MEMDIYQFVRDFGWKIAIDTVELHNFFSEKHGRQNDNINVGGVNVNVSELRPLVESWNFLVSMYDSDVKKAQTHLKDLKKSLRRNPEFPNLESRIKRVETMIAVVKKVGTKL